MTSNSPIAMQPNYSAIQIANYFIRRGIEARKFLTQMQVLKLTYIAHGFSLAINDKELFDENAEAWEYGPVIPSVYSALRSHGSSPILSPIEVSDTLPIKEQDLEVLDLVWEVYQDFSALKLSSLTHQSGTPWDQVVSSEDYHKVYFNQMSDDIIRDYYIKFLGIDDKG